MEDHTRTGNILGTVNYLSPEQARGEPLDARTDIFSFGLTIYEMLTGRRALEGESSEEKIANLLSDTELRPVSEVCQDIPAALANIVTKAVRKKRNDRYASAGEMLASCASWKPCSTPAALTVRKPC